MREKKEFPNNEYISGLDGLRAVAVLTVLFYHMGIAPFLPGGFTGVDIFFVISGYIISRSIYKKKEYQFLKYLGNFYKRRILRIVPALFTCLLITHLVSIMFIPPSWKSELIHKIGLSAFFGFSNFTMIMQNDGYFAPSSDFIPFLHTWSLAVEEQFYLVFPVVFFLWIKFKDRKNALGFVSRMILPVLALLSMIISIHKSGTDHNQAYYLLHSRFWELTSGALLFQFQSRTKRIKLSTIHSRIAFILGLLLIIIGAVFSDPWSFPFPWALFPVFGTIFVIYGLTDSSSKDIPELHILSNPIMSYIGRISYSLYLWHWPVISILRWTAGYNTIGLKLLSLVVTVLFTVLSYHYIEIPVRRSQYLKKQYNWKVLISGLSILFIGLLLSQWMLKSRNTLSLSKTKETYIWNSGKYLRDEQDHPKYNDPELDHRQLFILGDSHTAHYRTMVNILSSNLGIQAHEYEKGDCDIAGLLRPMEQQNIDHYEDCLNEIKKLIRPGDIIFLASLRMPALSDRFEVMDISAIIEQHFSQNAVKDRQAALKEADTIIRDLEQLGLTVLISAPEPVLLIPPYRCSDWFNRNNPIASPGKSISTALLKEIRKPMMDSLEHLQELHPNLRIWDPLLILCTKEEFSAYDENNLPIYYDGDHLSAHGNRILEPSFEAKVLEIWKAPVVIVNEAKMPYVQMNHSISYECKKLGNEPNNFYNTYFGL